MRHIIVGISGASGAQIGISTLQVLATKSDIRTYLILTDAARKVVEAETALPLETLCSLAYETFDVHDIGAALASGSFHRDGMVVVPCSMKTLSALASSYTDNLLVRSGDVCLKERKPLVLVVRETPLHQIHLENMLKLARTGAIILPPMLTYYHNPQNINDMTNYVVGKILDSLGIENTLFRRWAEDPIERVVAMVEEEG